jgi:hypothetical protein
MLPNVLPEHRALAVAMMNGDISPQDAQAATRVFKALQGQVPSTLSSRATALGEKMESAARNGINGRKWRKWSENGRG